MFRIKTRLAFLSLVTLVGCGGTGYGTTGVGTPPPPPPANTIDATPSEVFTPGNLSVAVGQVVTFKFGSLGHNVFFAAQAGAPADIPGTNANTSVTRQFNTQGTFSYTCHIHPNMHGTVTVQ